MQKFIKSDTWYYLFKNNLLKFDMNQLQWKLFSMQLIRIKKFPYILKFLALENEGRLWHYHRSSIGKYKPQ